MVVLSGRLPVPLIRIAGVWRVGIFNVEEDITDKALYDFR
jgi:hypothetical protein